MSLKPAPSQCDRPLRLEYVDPSSLDEHPGNWKVHPSIQMDALSEALDRAGWAGCILYNEATNTMIDGHARKKLSLAKGLAAVPVLIGSWTPDQEKFLLLTLDPIASLAQMDPRATEILLRDMSGCGEAIAAILTSLAEDAKIIPAGDDALFEAAMESGNGHKSGSGGTGGQDGGGGGDGDAPAGNGNGDGPAEPPATFPVRVHCLNEEARESLMANLRAEGFDCFKV